MNRIQLSQLAVLATVAETRSFRKAAEELGIAPSAVSHAISALEDSVGIRLLARTTRSVSPTQEGRQLLEKLAPALADIGMALETLTETKTHPAGPLRITMPTLALEDLIMPKLGAFVEQFPDVQLELISNDNFEDIVEKGFDAGLRLGEHLEADMIAVKAGPSICGRIVATPAYFQTHPVPQHPRDLMQHCCIRRRFSSGRVYRWELENQGKALIVDVPASLTLTDQRLIRRAVLSDIGLAFLFDHRVAMDIAEGRLISVLEDWCAPFEGFYIYYPTRRQMRPALRAFVDFFRYRG
jgi:DNA-binding transcriptional LysR family regulator